MTPPRPAVSVPPVPPAQLLPPTCGVLWGSTSPCLRSPEDLTRGLPSGEVYHCLSSFALGGLPSMLPSPPAPPAKVDEPSETATHAACSLDKRETSRSTTASACADSASRSAVAVEVVVEAIIVAYFGECVMRFDLLREVTTGDPLSFCKKLAALDDAIVGVIFRNVGDDEAET